MDSGIKNVCAYARKMMIDGKIFNIDNTPIKHIGNNISKISSNVNQIAKCVNSTDSIYKEGIAELKEIINEIC